MNILARKIILFWYLLSPTAYRNNMDSIWHQAYEYVTDLFFKCKRFRLQISFVIIVSAWEYTFMLIELKKVSKKTLGTFLWVFECLHQNALNLPWQRSVLIGSHKECWIIYRKPNRYSTFSFQVHHETEIEQTDLADFETQNSSDLLSLFSYIFWPTPTQCILFCMLVWSLIIPLLVISTSVLVISLVTK